MEKIIIPERKGYKANLHGHTTDSDGRLTPEESKKYYKDNGYSILAYTDHLYMRDRSYLCDDEFVAINGYENGIINNTAGIGSKCYHLNFYSPSPSKAMMVGVDENLYKYFNRGKTQEQLAKSPMLNGFCDSSHNIKNLNNIIKEAKNLGYIVVYNHPVWSGHDSYDWKGLKGLTGMEIFNTGCYLEGYEEDNGYIYDEMLRAGQKIFCFANDDNHNLNPECDDSFGGFNVMFPEKLTYDAVFECMKNGRFYASTGATIKGVNLIDDKLFVNTENAAYIRLTTSGRYSKFVRMSEKPLTETVFDIPDFIDYFRITIKDINGKKAYTNAFFIKDLK